MQDTPSGSGSALTVPVQECLSDSGSVIIALRARYFGLCPQGAHARYSFWFGLCPLLVLRARHTLKFGLCPHCALRKIHPLVRALPSLCPCKGTSGSAPHWRSAQDTSGSALKGAPRKTLRFGLRPHRPVRAIALTLVNHRSGCAPSRDLQNAYFFSIVGTRSSARGRCHG